MDVIKPRVMGSDPSILASLCMFQFCTIKGEKKTPKSCKQFRQHQKLCFCCLFVYSIVFYVFLCSSTFNARTPGGSSGRASGSGGNDRGLVIHRVVKESGSSTNYPVLTKTNYNDWALLMKIKLRARCLWDAVECGRAAVELHEDRMALDGICSTVPPEMISTLATKASVKEAWDCIKTMRVGDDRIRKASAQREITGRLKAAEDYQPPPSSQNTDGKLYLTEEEWLECHKKEQEAKRSGAGSSGRNKRRGRKGCTGGSSDGSTYRRLFGPSIIFER
uniref:DUF4219 domain-containing protein n=1 Tax=Oryza sativa subsp. japonica TaxID=39947 RepID=Q2R8K5_ORYSJ|nr:hypothetical protein LOC_Os11g11870 [Oryza sativa Japonica Group]